MKRRSILPTLILLILLACLVLALVWISLGALPARAIQSFGPPAASLDSFSRTQLAARLLLQENELKLPLDPQGSSRSFSIQLGESTYSITARLQEEGFIRSAPALRDYLVYAGMDTSLQAGEFSLSPQMTAIQIAQALQDATPGEVTFRILPGWRVEEIAASLPTSGLKFAPESLLSRIKLPASTLAIAQELPLGASLEGFLFPDSYQLSREISVDEFVATVIEDFEIKVDGAMREAYRQQGLSLFQAVTLASLVQREAIIEAEMPMIASVFINRLAASMKLDSDPTVQYALGFNPQQNTWWTNPLSLEDLQIDSLYNTYRYPGLPPGPIANPGLSALQAVASPAQTPYYYFRAACDGSGLHNFAQTFAEHQQNACP
ncbi:MAG: endolytic transglycosylase MltG [Anaerolineales bacterium]|nr:endolytic transglycosylase MltG [Anaerolineales bacterium]